MTTTNQNIEQLLSQCITNDQSAQFEVYKRYNKAMYNTAFRIVKDSAKAEDVMQESFLSAFTKLNTLDDKKMFGAWLKRIVINNSVAHYNKTSKLKEVALDAVLYKVEDHNGLDESSNTSQKVKQILETIKTLKSNYALGLTLHLVEGYDYEEIGEIMNISYANCRTMISRAKESLRQKLSPTLNA